MSNRDPRWERVCASIVDDPTWPDAKRIEIEVRGDRHRVGQVIVASEQDMRFLGQILDEMVCKLDEAIHA